jgi:signal peptidase I
MRTNTPYNEAYGRKQLINNEIYGEILVRPVDKKENYIKRCVAVPGDSIKIINSQMYINGEKQDLFDEMQYNYYLATDGQSINTRFIEKYGISQEDLANAQRFVRSEADLVFIQNHPVLSKYNSGNLFMIPLTKAKAEKIKQNPFIKAIVKSVKPVGQYNSGVFPHTPELYPWNEDNFGSLYIPKAGTTTPLNMETLPFYRRLIEIYEKNDLKVEGDKIYINGELATSYTFKMNYYWLMGDNRHNSADSRFWGFVPEDHVVGKALMVWFSSDKDQPFPANIRWDRILTMIH